MTRRDLFKFAALAPVAALAAKLKSPEPVKIEIPFEKPGRASLSDNLSMAEMEMAFRRKWFKEPKRPYRPGREM